MERADWRMIARQINVLCEQTLAPGVCALSRVHLSSLTASVCIPFCVVCLKNITLLTRKILKYFKPFVRCYQILHMFKSVLLIFMMKMFMSMPVCSCFIYYFKLEMAWINKLVSLYVNTN